MCEVIETGFKIRRRSDGLFSTGGMYPKFNTKGKLWRQRNFLTNHLHVVSSLSVYDDCDVVIVEVRVQDTSQTVEEFCASARQTKKDKELSAKKAMEDKRKEERRVLYKTLQKEFG